MSELQAGAEPVPVVVTETETPSFESTMEAVYEKNYPDSRVNRDPVSQQFKSKESAEVAAPETVSEQEPVEVKAEPAKPAISRPQSWSSELDDWWASLPPERQEFLSKREGEAHKRISELGEQAKAYEPLKHATEPLRTLAKRAGVTEQEVIGRFLNANARLESDPAGAIRDLAQSYGVDLSKFATAQQGEQPVESTQITSLHQQIANLTRQLSETQNRINAREQSEQQTQRASLDSMVEDFAKGKDYWSDIEQEVVAQIHAIKLAHPQKDVKTVLQEAHDRAVRLNDAVQNKLSEAKRKEDADKKAAEDKRKADEAKRLASLNTKSKTGAAPRSGPLNMEQEMGEIFDRVANG